MGLGWGWGGGAGGDVPIHDKFSSYFGRRIWAGGDARNKEHVLPSLSESTSGVKIQANSQEVGSLRDTYPLISHVALAP